MKTLLLWSCLPVRLLCVFHPAFRAAYNAGFSDQLQSDDKYIGQVFYNNPKLTEAYFLGIHCADLRKPATVCGACKGKGWLRVDIDGFENRRAIERCDTCVQYATDAEAVAVAAKEGVVIGTVLQQ
jgi:hypothetical protein